MSRPDVLYATCILLRLESWEGFWAVRIGAALTLFLDLRKGLLDLESARSQTRQVEKGRFDSQGFV